MTTDSKVALIVAGAILAAVAAPVGCCVKGCGPDYSDGSRVGVITKISTKGLLFKSNEAEMLVALPVDVAGTTQPERFDFNVSPETLKAAQEAMQSGRRVEVRYRQWAWTPITIEHSHVAVEIRPTGGAR